MMAHSELINSEAPLPTYHDVILSAVEEEKTVNNELCDECKVRSTVSALTRLAYDTGRQVQAVNKLVIQSQDDISSVYRILREMNFQERNLEIRDLVMHAASRNEFVYSCNLFLVVYIIVLLTALIVPLIVSIFY